MLGILVPILCPAIAPALAEEPDPLDTMPELIGLRLRHDIPVTLRDGACGEGRADQTESVPSSDVPVLTWAERDADVRWSISDDLAGVGVNGEAILPADLPPGVHRVCLASGDRATKVDLRIEPAPYTQINLSEIGLDGFERQRGITQAIVTGEELQTSSRWISSDFVRTDRVLNEDGRELKLYRQHDYDDHIYRYEAVLAEPAQAGDLIVLESRGTGEPVVLSETGPGEMTYEFHHTPNAPVVTRRVEIFRLPANAEVLVANDYSERGREGRVEIVKVTSIPVDGAGHTFFRYRVPEGWLGIPGPRVVQTVPASGSADVDTSVREIRVTFDADMRPHSWSWVQVDEDSYPDTRGKPYYDDHRTCVLPVKLKPGTEYVVWINGGRFDNFRGVDGRAAKPYEIRFRTAER